MHTLLDLRGAIPSFIHISDGKLSGHPSLGKLAQGTVCKILAEHEVKPYKVRYYLEKRDPEFDPKMAEILLSTGKWRCCGSKRTAGKARTKTVAPAEASSLSPTTRNQGSKRY
jgi:hypothetical protein